MKKFTVVFYDITYGKCQPITVAAETKSAAEFKADQRCSIPAGFRETLRITEEQPA